MVWLPEFFFAKKNLDMCVKCGCAKFRTSAHPHACKMCATCMVWLSEFFFAKKFLEMCVKVRMCEISHVRTPARVQNVCNVHGVAARVFFCKKIFGNVCESADVRNFARPHTRTLAKCVQCAWCGCQSFFFQKFFGYVCESTDVQNFARPHTRTRAKCVQRAWCGCRSFFLQKNFWKCVGKCRCAKIRTSAHLHACEMCE